MHIRDCVVGGRIEPTRKNRAFGTLLTFGPRSGRSRGAKVPKKVENFEFLRVQGAEMHLFARNGQTSAEILDLKVGPTQIDPRGSSGAIIFEVCPYWAV